MGELIHYEIHTDDGVINFIGNVYYYDHAEDTWRWSGPVASEIVVSGRRFQWMKNEPATSLLTAVPE